MTSGDAGFGEIARAMAEALRARAGAASSATLQLGGLRALESLQITADRVELAALAGHPVLWDLQVEGVGAPLDLAVLRTLPRLTRLSLDGSVVADWGPVGDLPALRVLKLDIRQVHDLLTSGCPPPAAPARGVARHRQDDVAGDERTALGLRRRRSGGHGDRDRRRAAAVMSSGARTRHTCDGLRRGGRMT